MSERDKAKERVIEAAKALFGGAIRNPHGGYAVDSVQLGDLGLAIVALAQLDAVPFPSPSSAWLIERGQATGHSPTIWWCGGDVRAEVGEDEMLNWTEDAQKARRFVSKKSAETLAQKLFPTSLYSVTEHLFLQSPPPSDVCECGHVRDAHTLSNGHDQCWHICRCPKFRPRVEHQKGGE